MLDSHKDDHTKQILQIRKKHLLFGVVSVLGIVICIIFYLFQNGLYVGFSKPAPPPEPLSLELITRFELIESKFNEAIAQFNELQLLKEKLEKQNTPNSKTTTKKPPKDLGKGGAFSLLKPLEFKANGYPIDPSFNAMDQIIDTLNNQFPLIKNVFTISLYRQTNLPSGIPILGEYILSSGFGLRPDPFTQKEEFHPGIDFSAELGTPVVAAESGIVSKVVPNNDGSGYGNYIEISHAKGIVTKYAHLASVAVQVNQKLVRGEVIGFVGNSGRSTGPHLHFEVSVDGNLIDPLASKTAISVKPKPTAMAAFNSENKSKCADLLLLVVDENAPLMKECLKSQGKNAKDLLISRYQLKANPSLSIEKNSLPDEDCAFVDQDQKLKSGSLAECHSSQKNN